MSVRSDLFSEWGGLVASMHVSDIDRDAAVRMFNEHRDVLIKCSAYKKYELFMTTHGQQVAQEKQEKQRTDPWHVQVARKLVHLHSNAQKRGKDFDLSLQDVNQLLRARNCFYTGVELTSEKGPYQRTVDRVDNTKGYVSGNVVACCHLANQIKNRLFEAPTDELNTNVDFMNKLITTLMKHT